MNETFTYENVWSSPRFWFKQNIGDFIGHTSLGLVLEEFNEHSTFFKLSGRFKVSGEYHSVKQFAQRLEQEYGEYLSSCIDWAYYDSILL